LKLRDRLEELREVGLRTAIFRAAWTLEARSGLGRFGPRAVSSTRTPELASERSPFPAALDAARAVRDRISADSLRELRGAAEASCLGSIRCFGTWSADFGVPTDWYRDPASGRRWTARGAWSAAARTSVGDVKLVWEAARFPQAYIMGRAGAFFPELAEPLAQALLEQVQSFREAAPPTEGIHWSSGQEVAIRLLAWTFAHDVLLGFRCDASRTIADGMLDGAQHIENLLPFARHAVRNNHLISESLGLYLVGVMLPTAPESRRWRALGRQILATEAKRQFYDDGGYLQLSHNYHRNVVQLLTWAAVLARADGTAPPASWESAIDRSLAFMFQHQNPTDGRMPNFGPNDGSLPSILSTCARSDFRPELQVASVLARGERLFDAGPWDEAVVWLLGPAALDAPLRPPKRRSYVFGTTGLHVLRLDDDRTSFATLRCGDVRHRYGHIDMLHVDVWWRGINVAIDPGTYSYNGPAGWHDHFMRTGSHNTLTIDDADQMLHLRQFSSIYPTRAQTVTFREEATYALLVGEHAGYARQPTTCTHCRSVVLTSAGWTIVADTVSGAGAHRIRLHWLCGDLPWRQIGPAAVRLSAGPGDYDITVYNSRGLWADGTVVSGRASPPRGWYAPAYGVRRPTASVVAELIAPLPVTFVTLLAPAGVRLDCADGLYTARLGTAHWSFRVGPRGVSPC
jgi:Heparinase II/III-like protein/Heparinase II/III N-terminus